MTTTENTTTSTDGLRIVKLTAENVKRLRAVEITPDGALVEVTGRNAQGKTSVLDSIWYALGGKPNVARPIRDGQDTASVSVDLGDLTVTRAWKGDRSTLTVTSADGAKFPKPQAILDDLAGRLSFDPLGFCGLSDKDQRAALLDVVDLPFDPAKLDAERQATFDERTTINRDAKRLAAQLDGLDKPADDLPDAEITPDLVSVSDALDAYKAGQRQHDEYAEQVAAVAAADKRCQDIERQMDELHTALDAARRERDALPDPDTDPHGADLPDLDGLRRQVDDVETTNRQRQVDADDTNRQVRAAAEYRKQAGILAETRTQADDLTKRLDEIDRRKADALAAAAMPVDGLGFDEGGVTYQGVPFRQCSSAEQLRVSLAMGMALNPRLRVLLIRDGSLLDTDSMTAVSDMAREHGYQVWIETVSDGNRPGVVIEDGAVAGGAS